MSKFTWRVEHIYDGSPAQFIERTAATVKVQGAVARLGGRTLLLTARVDGKTAVCCVDGAQEYLAHLPYGSSAITVAASSHDRTIVWEGTSNVAAIQAAINACQDGRNPDVTIQADVEVKQIDDVRARLREALGANRELERTSGWTYSAGFGLTVVLLLEHDGPGWWRVKIQCTDLSNNRPLMQRLWEVFTTESQPRSSASLKMDMLEVGSGRLGYRSFDTACEVYASSKINALEIDKIEHGVVFFKTYLPYDIEQYKISAPIGHGSTSLRAELVVQLSDPDTEGRCISLHGEYPIEKWFERGKKVLLDRADRVMIVKERTLTNPEVQIEIKGATQDGVRSWLAEFVETGDGYYAGGYENLLVAQVRNDGTDVDLTCYDVVFCGQMLTELWEGVDRLGCKSSKLIIGGKNVGYSFHGQRRTFSTAREKYLSAFNDKLQVVSKPNNYVIELSGELPEDIGDYTLWDRREDRTISCKLARAFNVNDPEAGQSMLVIGGASVVPIPQFSLSTVVELDRVNKTCSVVSVEVKASPAHWAGVKDADVDGGRAWFDLQTTGIECVGYKVATHRGLIVGEVKEQRQLDDRIRIYVESDLWYFRELIARETVDALFICPDRKKIEIELPDVYKIDDKLVGWGFREDERPTEFVQGELKAKNSLGCEGSLGFYWHSEQPITLPLTGTREGRLFFRGERETLYQQVGKVSSFNTIIGKPYFYGLRARVDKDKLLELQGVILEVDVAASAFLVYGNGTFDVFLTDAR